MALVRFCIVIASLCQLVLGGILAWGLLYRDEPGVLALIVCTAVLLAGLWGLLRVRRSVAGSSAPLGACRFNMTLFIVFAAAALMLVGLERLQGADVDRLVQVGTVSAVLVAPFLVSGLGFRILATRRA